METPDNMIFFVFLRHLVVCNIKKIFLIFTCGFILKKKLRFKRNFPKRGKILKRKKKDFSLFFYYYMYIFFFYLFVLGWVNPNGLTQLRLTQLSQPRNRSKERKKKTKQIKMDEKHKKYKNFKHKWIKTEKTKKKKTNECSSSSLKM
jgi:hypothetical protein